MKKVCYISICLILFIVCGGIMFGMQSHPQKIVLPENANLLYRKNSFLVYDTDAHYILQISETDKGVEYSKDRKCQKFYGINPIKNIDIYDYLYSDYNTIENELGKYHIDLTSGFFTPTYITEDGYLISFWVENNIVSYVEKRDIFTYEVVDKTD